ncbi:hypothetical protein [Aureliella helgolandensis]|nr:hypothetical protein [Aureliella helgolandensis]
MKATNEFASQIKTLAGRGLECLRKRANASGDNQETEQDHIQNSGGFSKQSVDRRQFLSRKRRIAQRPRTRIWQTLKWNRKSACQSRPASGVPDHKSSAGENSHIGSLSFRILGSINMP